MRRNINRGNGTNTSLVMQGIMFAILFGLMVYKFDAIQNDVGNLKRSVDNDIGKLSRNMERIDNNVGKLKNDVGNLTRSMERMDHKLSNLSDDVTSMKETLDDLAFNQNLTITILKEQYDFGVDRIHVGENVTDTFVLPKEFEVEDSTTTTSAMYYKGHVAVGTVTHVYINKDLTPSM